MLISFSVHLPLCFFFFHNSPTSSFSPFSSSVCYPLKLVYPLYSSSDLYLSSVFLLLSPDVSSSMLLLLACLSTKISSLFSSFPSTSLSFNVFLSPSPHILLPLLCDLSSYAQSLLPSPFTNSLLIFFFLLLSHLLHSSIVFLSISPHILLPFLSDLSTYAQYLPSSLFTYLTSEAQQHNTYIRPSIAAN